MGNGRGGREAPLTILQKIQAAEDAILVFVVRLVESCFVGEGCGCGGESKSRGEGTRREDVSGSRGKLGSGAEARQGLRCQRPSTYSTQFNFVYIEIS